MQNLRVETNPTVLIADDFPTTRLGVRALLEKENFHVVGEASDGHEVFRYLEGFSVDLLLLDLGLPGFSGLEIAERVRWLRPSTRIVVHTMLADEEMAAKLFRAGASAYVLKQDSPDSIVAAAERALAGRTWLTPSLSSVAIKNAERLLDASSDPVKSLSAREFEVLRLTAVGLTSRETATKLGISPRTVETHRGNLMVKLGLRSHREIVRYALRRGIIIA